MKEQAGTIIMNEHSHKYYCLARCRGLDCIWAIFLLIMLSLGTSGCSTMFIMHHSNVNSEYNDEEYCRQILQHPAFNSVRFDINAFPEVWQGPDDYLLPPWLDRSLNTVAIVVDIPFAIVGDILTFPWQLHRYQLLYKEQ
jgi:uncharacterized protein YceK